MKFFGKFFRVFVVSVFFNCYIFGSLINQHLQVPADTRQVIIHFTQAPHDKTHHKQLNDIIEKSLLEINNKLIADGYLPPLRKTDDQYYWETFKYRLKDLYYHLFYRRHTERYPKKLNYAFFTRRNPSLGVYTMYIPDGVPDHIFINYLRTIYNAHGVEFHIDKDIPVHIVQPDTGLEGLYFNEQEVQQLLAGDVPKKIPDPKKDMVTQAFRWHLSFPTTGLLTSKPLYPFIPHFFSLWELAPHKGAGINVAIIDTGVAAYSVNDERFKKNKNLLPHIVSNKHNFNIVSQNGLDPLEQLIHHIKSQKYIADEKFNEEELERQLPSMIINYVQNNNDQQIKQYLLDNGPSDFKTADNELSQKGQTALQDILQGSEGIKPITGTRFHVKQLEDTTEQPMVLEFIPAPEITRSPKTFIAGHGTHTFGLIASQDIGNGILGLAPQANTFMIKAFQDNGVTDQSTLVAALKKALIHDADIVNLSLKIADNLDMTIGSSKLLQRVIDLIPYVVAASGNGGDPALPGYAGIVESYPARFANVPFDVGAFRYTNKQAMITSFSQYEPTIGPLFVAPGFDIVSTGVIPGQKEDSMYLFMAGTSMAAPIMTGFLALMLGEFENDFTREELLKVCYSSTFKMHDTVDWNTKVILGVLDMRCALFVLHVLRVCKTKIPEIMNKQFDQVLSACLYILVAIVQDFGTKFGIAIDFKVRYLDYINAANGLSDSQEVKNYIERLPHTLAEAIAQVSTVIIAQFNKDVELPQFVTPSMRDGIKELFLNTRNVFETMPAVARRLYEHKSHGYWKESIEQVKKELAKEEEGVLGDTE